MNVSSKVPVTQQPTTILSSVAKQTWENEKNKQNTKQSFIFNFYTSHTTKTQCSTHETEAARIMAQPKRPNFELYRKRTKNQQQTLKKSPKTQHSEEQTKRKKNRSEKERRN